MDSVSPRKRLVACVDPNRYQFSPLALGMILAYARSYKDGLLQKYYDFRPLFIGNHDELLSALREGDGGIFLFSDYLWTVSTNLDLSRIVKESSPDNITIHGGPSLPKYPEACDEFFQTHSHIDIGVRGEGEVGTAEILERIALNRDQPYWVNLESVNGLTFRDREKHCWTRTPERTRLQEVDLIPSPYLTGLFDTEEVSHWKSAVIETNRGCPYGCTFCDWGSATLQKVRRFSLDRIRDEVEWIAVRHINVLWIADANFGIFDRDIEIAETIAECKLRFGSPGVVAVNYAKNATERLASIVGIFKKAGIIAPAVIALQTSDEQVLKNVHRSNIKTQKYEELIGIYRKAKLPIATELMIGLPGATMDSFKADLQFFFDRRIHVKAYLTKMLPNSPMADREYVRKYQITVDKNMFVVSTYSFTAFDRSEMQSLFKFYEAFVGYSLLKYYLYYLQIQHDVDALDFIHKFLIQIHRFPNDAPETINLLKPWLPENVEDNFENNCDQLISHNWQDFYEEVLTFTERQYGLPRDPSLETLVKVQQALIPQQGKTFPQKSHLQHDVVDYFGKMRSILNVREYANTRPAPLNSYPPGELNINDPLGICQSMWSGVRNFMIHVIFWELDSELLEKERIAYLTRIPAAKRSTSRE